MKLLNGSELAGLMRFAYRRKPQWFSPVAQGDEMDSSSLAALFPLHRWEFS
jgi:hypothetical protein